MGEDIIGCMSQAQPWTRQVEHIDDNDKREAVGNISGMRSGSNLSGPPDVRGSAILIDHHNMLGNLPWDGVRHALTLEISRHGTLGGVVTRRRVLRAVARRGALLSKQVREARRRGGARRFGQYKASSRGNLDRTYADDKVIQKTPCRGPITNSRKYSGT